MSPCMSYGMSVSEGTAPLILSLGTRREVSGKLRGQDGVPAGRILGIH
jgi:hypothetical protein